MSKALNTVPATTHPANVATRCIQIWLHDSSQSTALPITTAGLNAPPEIDPTAYAPTVTVNQIARP
jgi:hypothetical protein